MDGKKIPKIKIVTSNIVVLIAMPDQAVYRSVEQILSSNNYVTVHCHPSKTYGYVKKHKPNIVVLADNAGIDNSLEIAGRIIRDYPVLPVILVEKLEKPDLIRRIYRAGVFDCISISNLEEELIPGIERAIQKINTQLDTFNSEVSRKTQKVLKTIDEMEILYDLGRQSTQSLSIETVLTSIISAAVKITDADEGSLLLVDEQTGELCVRAAKNYQEDFVRTFRLPVGDALTTSVLQSGKPILYDEASLADMEMSRLGKSLLYHPLKNPEKIFGILAVINRVKRKTFTEQHLRNVSLLAEYAEIALINSQKYQDLSDIRDNLDTVFSYLKPGLIIVDEDRCIHAVNKSAREIFNLDNQPVEGMKYSEVFPQLEIKNLIDNAVRRVTDQAELEMPDGHIYSGQCSTIPKLGLVITLHDITQQKKLDRIKSDFVSTVSHDLRSPLTAILGYVELIERAGPINPNQREFIRRVFESVHNINTLVDNLLSLGRIETGFDTHRESISLESMLQESIDNLKGQIEEKELGILVQISPGIPNFMANAIQFRRLVDNLIENAIKYTPRGGNVSIQVHSDQSQIILRVEDNGIGVPELEIKYIFEKYFRASNIDKNAVGSGLGLAIVKSVVETHGGRIWVDSKVGEGTTFTVLIPITGG